MRAAAGYGLQRCHHAPLPGTAARQLSAHCMTRALHHTRLFGLYHPTVATADLIRPATSKLAPACVSAGVAASLRQPHSQFTSAAWQPSLRHQGRWFSSVRSAEGAGNVEVEDNTTHSSPVTGLDGRPNIITVLRERGLLQDVTSPELEKAAGAGPLSVYCGFDPTAESLHLGNLMGILVLSWFQRTGHGAVALLGGATGLVGDPSGKSSERPVLSDEQSARNIAGIKATLQSLLKNEPVGGDSTVQDARILNNIDWFGNMKLMDFLQVYGKYARVGTMLARDSVRTRLESDTGISFTEFCYQLLQGADFVHLNKHHGVRVQTGGSDQWGNIIAGTELIRKVEGNENVEPCFGVTFPLLLKADGRKFGKSEDGAIWLAAEKLSPFKFYQYFLSSVSDKEVIKFLRMLTFLPLEEIAAIETHMGEASYRPNAAQRKLAEEVTRFVHGEEGLGQALAATKALAPGSETKLDAAALEAIASEAPSASLARAEVVGVALSEVAVAAGLQPSKSATRRLIKGGGMRVNNIKISDEDYVMTTDDLIDGRFVLLSTGKKNKLLLRIE